MRDVDCCVCMENMKISVRLPCNHMFCIGCVLKIVPKKCPLCRNSFEDHWPKEKRHTNIWNGLQVPSRGEEFDVF